MRRNISITEKTDKKIRELGDGKKGDFSRIITEAVQEKWDRERPSVVVN